jgi:hypothetical protein
MPLLLSMRRVTTTKLKTEEILTDKAGAAGKNYFHFDSFVSK